MCIARMSTVIDSEASVVRGGARNSSGNQDCPAFLPTLFDGIRCQSTLDPHMSLYQNNAKKVVHSFWHLHATQLCLRVCNVITSSVVTWVESVHGRRSFQVCVYGSLPQVAEAVIGVPRGSVLGHFCHLRQRLSWLPDAWPSTVCQSF